MTKCEILKSFQFSQDGVTAKYAEAGGNADIPDALVVGLEAAGYLTRGEEEKTLGGAPENKALSGGAGNTDTGPLEIPGNWRELPWFPENKGDMTLRSLASSLSGESISNKDDAIAAVELEIDTRAHASRHAKP